MAVVAIVLVVGIGAIVQAERMTGNINQVKLGASIVVALLIATTPYGVGYARPNQRLHGHFGG